MQATSNLTDDQLVEKYGLTAHPMWDVPAGVWCQSIHHEEPFEQTTEPGRERLLYVVRHKPEGEIPVRLAAMRPCTPEVAERLKPLDDDYQAKRKPLYDDYQAKLKPLDDDYQAKLKPLDDDYQAKLKPLYVGGWYDWDRRTLDFTKEVSK